MSTQFTIANVSAVSSRNAISPAVKSSQQINAPAVRNNRVQRIELERRDRFGRFGRR
ncbi:hypothetical protein [Noviherbaspirillum aerium]|uniref:hypothetical protein n=1 Tax=Noviherbaspirillum aerium TaxID=2588497 RepID=UPI00178C6A70|nr:hypothetical protein [Noviherbaspirillum aerium]